MCQVANQMTTQIKDLLEYSMDYKKVADKKGHLLAPKRRQTKYLCCKTFGKTGVRGMGGYVNAPEGVLRPKALPEPNVIPHAPDAVP